MDKQTHTPGPWTQGYGNDVYAGTRPMVGEYRVAWTEPRNKTNAGWEEAFANARLIAAAPDLLQALARLVDAAEDSMPYRKDGDTIDRENWEAMDAAREAIRKAKGEEHE